MQINDRTDLAEEYISELKDQNEEFFQMATEKKFF